MAMYLECFSHKITHAQDHQAHRTVHPAHPVRMEINAVIVTITMTVENAVTTVTAMDAVNDVTATDIIVISKIVAIADKY